MDFEQRVCAVCAGDDFVAGLIRERGDSARCSFCKRKRKTIALSDLADMVHEIFVRYARTEDAVPTFDFDDPWRGGGKTPSYIIMEDILRCEPELADALVECLAQANWRDVASGGEDYYDDTVETYALQVPHSDTYIEEWSAFVESVKHGTRFFNAHQHDYLKRILTPLLRGDLHKGIPPIVEVGAEGSSIQRIYRGREANSMAARRVIYENPSAELSPPPPALRRQGRMNATGIAAFYGCTDVETCVAELRVPVGGTAVVGEFAFLRPIQVLDLRTLDRSAVAGLSWFDPAFAEKAAYGRFIRSLHDIIRAPVLPGSETLEYLPTQMLAEYLAFYGKPRVEGVLFVSSLTSGPDEPARTTLDHPTGVNIVLFAGASAVTGDRGGPTRRVVRIREPIYDEDLAWDSEDVEVRDEPEDETPPEDYPESNDALEPSLQLLGDSLKVARVRGITYAVDERPVSVSRATPHDPAAEVPF